MNDRIIKLKDGRRLAYREFGEHKGKPLFYFHGWPASRLSGKEMDEAAKKLGVRVISPDRPGFGLSDYQENRTLLDWADDIGELADQLGIKMFSVVGVSGGGPYAVVCAYKLPKRVLKAGVVVGLSQIIGWRLVRKTFWLNALGWLYYHRFPRLRYLAARIAQLEYKTFPMIGKIAGFQAKEDRLVMKDRSMETLTEAFRQGALGAEEELRVLTDDWGFDLKSVQVPVYLWYGAKDRNVSDEMGKYYASNIPKSRLIIDPIGGHLARYNYEDKIIGKLV